MTAPVATRFTTFFSRSLRPAPLLLWTGTLAYLSLSPGVQPPPGPLGWDKFNHFAAYFILGLLLSPVLAAGRQPTAGMLAGGWLICAAYGISLEGLQGEMGLGRQWEWGDLLANALGALTACVLFCLVSGRSCRR